MEKYLDERIAAGPLDVRVFLDLAIALAENLARFHDRHALHGALAPRNIVWDPKTGRASLGAPAEPSSKPDGDADLAYLSPEQTGRTARAPDRRSDLYALGAIYYHLLTGRPPFAGSDRLELIHAHLARRPVAPHEARAGIPSTLSGIVLRLLAKAPERRYASAETLAADLREARARLVATGRIEPFPLAHSGELHIPERLYGRTGELASLPQLAAALGAGERILVLVTGEPGIGKTALANQLGPLVAQAGGFFAFGKYDQLGRNTPYSALVQALRALVRRLLAEPEAALADWRRRLQQALAPNGRLLVDVIPELAHLVGPQPGVPVLGAVESKNRFRLAFEAFIRVFAQRAHPLALFLDDLQWVDASSLDLLQDLLAAPDIEALAIVAAYRDDEVPATHPLALALTSLRELGTRIHELRLHPLDASEVAALLRDALGLETQRLRGLADLLVSKTGGNPFFLRQLLESLRSEGLIRLDAARRTWQFDLAEIERAAVTANVVELMVRAIDRVPSAARELLKVLSCIGNGADLQTLAAVTGRSEESVRADLSPALERGLLRIVHDSAMPAVQFVHDRVQQAAYSLVSERERPALHLRIGRLMLQGPPAAALFDVVDQLNRGEVLIGDSGERWRIAELNLQAGRRAKASAAYEASFAYFGFALDFMGAAAWKERPELAFEGYFERAESAYLTARHDVAEALIEEALEHAPSRLASVELYTLRVVAATVGGDYARALRYGHMGLALFGLAWPEEDLEEASEAETARVMENLRLRLGARRIEDLAQDPEVQDAEMRACMRLLSMLGPPAYFHDPGKLVFILSRITNLSLTHGPSPYSAYGYTFYGALHNQRTGDYETGHAFGRLALALARRFGNRSEESRTFQVFGLIVNSWKARLATNVPLFREGYQAGLESGQLQYAAYNLVALLINGLPLGTPLESFEADVEASLAFSTRHKDKTMVEFSLAYRQAVRCLTGRTAALASFDDADFSEAAFVDDARDNRTAVAFYWVLRQQVAYLLGDIATARRCGKIADEMIASAMGMVIEAEHVFYSALTAAASYEEAAQEEKPALLVALGAAHERLVDWAEHCPENFLHKARLVAAEIARLREAPLDAQRLYDEAIQQARREGFVHEEALAAELAGRFSLRGAQPGTAMRCLRDARDGYRRWGATAKVRALEQAHPRLAAGQPELHLDALALIKASQAISAETDSERLLVRILSVVAEVSGAESGALVQLDADGAIAVHARVGTPERELPHAIVRYALRVREPLVLADASAEGPFAGDAEVRALGVRSLLCLPLPVQAGALVYLENRELRGAFPPERVELVRALAHQAAISFENTRLVAALRESERRLGFALEASQLGQWDLDLRRRTASRTPQHDRIFGYATMLPQWTYGMFLEHVVEEDRAAVDAKFQAAATGGEALDFECRIRRADGATRWIWSRGQVERDAGGAPTRMLGTIQDITERKRNEEALREDDRRKDEFLATLSHELRNPLAPLTNSLHLLKLAGTRGPDVGRLHEMMERQVNHMVRLVDDLLEMTRITRGTFELRREHADLAAVVRNAVETAEPLIRQAGHQLDISLPPEPLAVDGDPVRLAQILANLLNNAAKYTEPGGRITLELRREGPNARIRVHDNGQGIAPADLQRIFEMFSRGGGSDSRVQGGLGIGLSLARRLVEMHGGTIEATSEGLGAGAEFTVRLPLSQQMAPAQEPESSQAAIAQKRILVVDDNRDGAESLAMILEFMGADVHLANDGPAALEAFDAYRPDVVLLDIGMPGMDGYEVARHLRRRHDASHVPIIAITGWGQEQDKQAAREAGFDHHLTKPPDPAALRALIASLR